MTTRRERREIFREGVLTMRTTTILIAVAIGLIALEVHGAEPSLVDLTARIDSLEAQLGRQDAELRKFRSVVNHGSLVGSPDCNGWSIYGGYELTILEPFFSDASSGPGFDESFGTGHRFELGMESHRGWGARARYWMYNHTLDGHSLYAGEYLHLDVDSLDMELTFRERFRRWDLLFSGGARYGRNSYGSETLFGPGEARFEGVGPTFCLEAERAIGCGGLHLIGEFRGSMLFGDVDFFGATVEDELTTVLENQLGIGWNRRVGGATLDVRAVWESQFWLNNAFADALFGLGTNLGFTGPTVSVALTY